MLKIALRILFGIVFILSALAKLYPVESFENLLIQYSLSNYLLAPFIARALIGLELLIGSYMLFSQKVNRTVFKLIVAFMVVMCGFLIIQLISEGNQANCGCMGELIPMSPIESLIKNVALIAILFGSRKSTLPSVFSKKWILAVLLLPASFGLPYVLNPVGWANVQSVKVNEPVDLTGLPPQFQTGVQIDFTKGKQLIAFFSTSCEHCKVAAGKLSTLRKKDDLNNIYFIIGGEEEEIYESFISESHSEEVPVVRFYDDEFFKYSGGRLPAIVYLEDGVIRKRWYGDLFDVSEVRATLLP